MRPRTAESYEQTVRVHLAPGIGPIRLMKLNTTDVKRYLALKLDSGLSPRSVQYHHAVLRVALGQAVKSDGVGRNVAALVDAPRVRRHEIKPLSLEQARALLEAVRGHRLEALYTVALAIGLRQGEALGLRWQDLELEAGTIEVRTTLQRIDGTLQLAEPKTERSRRRLSLPAFATSALREHKIRQLEERLRAGSFWDDRGLVFTTHTGGPVAKENLRRPWGQILERAGLKGVRFHDLRHSCASLLHAQGADLRLIMEVLGHTQLSTTADVYTHVFEPMKQEAASRMDAAFGDVSAGRGSKG